MPATCSGGHRRDQRRREREVRGTVLGFGAVGEGASARVDGRVMANNAVTLDAIACATACSDMIVLPGRPVRASDRCRRRGGRRYRQRVPRPAIRRRSGQRLADRHRGRRAHSALQHLGGQHELAGRGPPAGPAPVRGDVGAEVASAPQPQPVLFPQLRARVARARALHHPAALGAGRAQVEALQLRRDRRGLVGQRRRRGLGRVAVAAVRRAVAGLGLLASASAAGPAVSPRISASWEALRARTSAVRMPSSSCRSASP